MAVFDGLMRSRGGTLEDGLRIWTSETNKTDTEDQGQGNSRTRKANRSHHHILIHSKSLVP